MNRKTQQGVALVTTLIFLSIVTFITIAFLGLARRERQNVTVQLDHNDAKLAAEGFMQRAQAEFVAHILIASNRFDYVFFVSQNDTNDIPGTNYSGYYQTVPYPSPAALTNLISDARPPVYVSTNNGGPLDFRYYMDFNRNQMFETNIAGWGGDPQWIGLLEDPTRPHGPNNRFIARGCYLVIPAGKTLDLNTIHNQSKYNDPNGVQEGFHRNQGVGPSEINTGGFLVELNTNVWQPVLDYAYTTNLTVVNSGLAFDNSLDILRRRMLGSNGTLSNFTQYFGPAGSNAMVADYIDNLANGPDWVTNSALLLDDDNALRPWFGSQSPNPYYDMQDFMNTNDSYIGNFSTRLRNQMQVNSEYDRWTYYRMMAQLGTDTGPAPSGRIHLNYDNQLANGQTNFVNWHPQDFFRLAADRMLKQSFNRSIITPSKLLQVYPVNEYSPAVQRVFQLAANIYDASTNRTFPYAAGISNVPYLPSVFRPWFTNSGTNLMILTYYEETNSAFATNCFYMDVNQAFTNSLAPGNQVLTNVLIYGIPVVIGARKGYPNFNEYSTVNTVVLTRKMEIQKVSTNAPPVFLRTNQMLVVSLTNSFNIEGWNSYTSSYPRRLAIFVANSTTTSLTDSNNLTLWPAAGLPYVTNRTFAPTTNASWPAWTSAASGNSFASWSASDLFITNHQYVVGSAVHFQPVASVTNFEHNVGYPVPNWNLNITNKVIYYVVDVDSDRVVDMVFLNDLTDRVNIATALMNCNDAVFTRMFDTNRMNNSTSPLAPTLGNQEQISASLGTSTLTPAMWRSYTMQPTGVQQQRNAIDTFRRFMGLPPLYNPATRYPLVANMQTPFNPTVKLFLYHTWQVNDPLVHYTTSDLTDNLNVANAIPYRGYYYTYKTPDFTNIRKVNERYLPWAWPLNNAGGNSTSAGQQAAARLTYEWTMKDSLIKGSDSWNFPGGPFPNPGWLGQVHRGTPWQTIYLKAAMPDTNLWNQWVGGSYTNTAFSNPTNDWKLLDLFTTVTSDSSSAGLLSINQTNIAAWAAVLSGVQVFSNTSLTTPASTNWYIEPGTYGFRSIYYGILNTLQGLSNQAPGNVFTNFGQILSVPELTVGSRDPNNPNSPPPRLSPYLYLDAADPNSGIPQGLSEQNSISDAEYERIPQQILGLLKLEDTPRFVVYAFGQSLKPADRSIVLTPGPTRGLCTNYQVTGEVAIRSVLRVEGSFTDPANPPRVVIESYNVLQPTDY